MKKQIIFLVLVIIQTIIFDITLAYDDSDELEDNNVENYKRSDDKKKFKLKNVLRKGESDEFFGKLDEAAKSHPDVGDFTVEKVKELIGQGNHLIIFDCKHPSYIDFHSKRASIKPNDVVKELKARDNCSVSEDNLWLVNGEKSSLSTYDASAKSLTKPTLPFPSLVVYFMKLNLCDDFMKYMKHPGYFLSNFQKPSVCQLTAKQAEAKWGCRGGRCAGGCCGK